MEPSSRAGGSLTKGKMSGTAKDPLEVLRAKKRLAITLRKSIPCQPAGRFVARKPITHSSLPPFRRARRDDGFVWWGIDVVIFVSTLWFRRDPEFMKLSAILWSSYRLSTFPSKVLNLQRPIFVLMLIKCRTQSRKTCPLRLCAIAR
jgi:hypothetical protein